MWEKKDHHCPLVHKIIFRRGPKKLSYLITYVVKFKVILGYFFSFGEYLRGGRGAESVRI